MIEQLSSLSLEQKIGQLFFIGIAGPELDEPTRALLAEVSPGGVCLFARNIKSFEQTRDLLDGIRSTSQIEPFLSIDQEGGLVDRLRRIMTPMPAASKLPSAASAAEQAAIIGETLGILGFNMDFAPVVDVIDKERGTHSNGLFSRTYGASKTDATEFAGAFLDSLQSKNIIGCLKHFPGLGAAQVDSHEELPVVSISATELEDTDLFPYRKLLQTADVHAVMAAHVCFPDHPLQEKDANGKLLPASLSYSFITKLLRGDMGFDGVVITDDLEMGAIIRNYGIGEACKMAILAGVDMLAICAGPENIRTGFRAVCQAVEAGEISMEQIDASLARIAKLKATIAAPPMFDELRLGELSAATAALAAKISN
ncbi:MAG TPA: glycoside hydrolase family 3 N-terminal domain-containing protein [Pyrinomonadaceae bacterium]|nr:glycoside hydrolase family 3 N-terminal domain-containing protein [Pyrinomonadaceae bacterium]